MTLIDDMKTNNIINETDVGNGKVATRYFEMLDVQAPDSLLAAYTAVDAVHTIAADLDISAGNFTITVTLRNGETFTTGSIAFDDAAAAIETAIDSAATSASITGWTNGDITVSGGDIATADVVLTFDGDSVSGTRHPVTTVADVDLADGNVGAVDITTGGHPDMPVTQTMIFSGPISSSGAVDDPTTWSRNFLVKTPKQSVAQIYAEQSSIELQDESVYATVMSLLGY